jgi:hypothetical protein
VSRSWSLTKGFKWKSFGLFCVAGVLFFLIFFGFGIVAAVALAVYRPLLVPAVIGMGLVTLFMYPFTSCVFTLFYYDLRVRKEAFDLEVLSRNLGIAVAAP